MIALFLLLAVAPLVVILPAVYAADRIEARSAVTVTHSPTRYPVARCIHDGATFRGMARIGSEPHRLVICDRCQRLRIRRQGRSLRMALLRINARNAAALAARMGGAR